ncbi:MAG: DNA internalization-related competence protein ComEC/Rec2 [Desulfobacterales bacterium]|nr:DNA internalization-related competence protein ComEC/Rec2 [Desulfobacterales bacterium]
MNPPLVPYILFLLCGILAGSKYSGYQYILYVFAVIALCFFIIGFFKKKIFLVFRGLLIFFIGYIFINQCINPYFPENHITHYLEKKLKIIGKIESCTYYSKGISLIISTESGEYSKNKFSLDGQIRLSVFGGISDFIIGDKISFKCKINPIRNFNNPYGFDYKRYMTFSKIWGTGYVKYDEIIFIEKSRENFRSKIENVRREISNLISANASDRSSGILKALIIGERNEIQPNINNAFNILGISHILAISGLHMGIIAAFSFMFFYWILSYFDYLLWKACTKKIASIFTMFPVIFYGLLSGLSFSTQRALIMVLCFLFSFLVEREKDILNILSFAALIILLLYPPSLFSASFQLSFLSVFVIVFGFSAGHFLKKIYSKTNNKLFIALTTQFLICFFATLGTVPLLMMYFNQISLIGVISNLIFLPLIGYIVVPLGLLGVFFSFFSLSLSGVLISISSVIVDKSIVSIMFWAKFPYFAVRTFSPNLCEVICYYGILFSILIIYSARHKKTMNIKRKAILAISIFSVVLTADVFIEIYERFWNKNIVVTAFDVGQGTSNFIELPYGYRILIDGGGFSDNSVFDVGERIISPFLSKKKVLTLDLVILSHGDSDHLNGLISILKNFKVKEVWTNGEQGYSANYKNFIKLIKHKKIKHPEFSGLNRNFIINGAKIWILSPKKNYLLNENNNWNSVNNNSIVVKIEYMNKAILFSGDILADTEKKLVSGSQKEFLKSTVLIAPHHGSKTSSTDAFVNIVRPEYVIISVGWKNRFKLPHKTVLKKYENIGAKVFRTDLDGAVVIKVNSQGIEVKPFK